MPSEDGKEGIHRKVFYIRVNSEKQLKDIKIISIIFHLRQFFLKNVLLNLIELSICE